MLTRNGEVITSHAGQVRKLCASLVPPHKPVLNILDVHLKVALEFILH